MVSIVEDLLGGQRKYLLTEQRDVTILTTCCSILVLTISHQPWGLSDWWWAECAMGDYCK